MTKTNKTTTKRPPIVTIMGHVDHGKTTLLDALRESKVVEGEAGGITQHIGAYQIKHQDQNITFIDTPGHAAFSQMRARGSKITDIIVLVVAANDGVKPQTIESIRHIKAADVPVIVAINKTDLPGSSPDMVKAQLTEHEIFCEGYGGQVPAVNISAIKRENLDELLETITLVADLNELTADPNSDLKAVIIETHQDKSRGHLATVIIQDGALNVSDTVYFNKESVKVRALTDEAGQPISQAVPGQPVVVMGFKSAPKVGGVLTKTPQDPPQATQALPDSSEVQDEDADTEVSDPESESPITQTLNLVLKADTQGSLEAIQNNLTEEVNILKIGSGRISTSDVMLANSTDSLIIGFNTSPTTAAKKLALVEKVPIRTYTIIYELLEYLEKRVLKLIEPTIDEEELGLAKVLQIFNIRGETIAGCKVTSGEITKQHLVRVTRGEETIVDTKIKSLKREKEDVDSVKKGNECGIVFAKSVDIKEGDVIKSYRIKEEELVVVD